MKIGIISYFDFDLYIKPKKNNLKIYENWNKVWEEVFKLSNKNNIHLIKYNFKDHQEYQKNNFRRNTQNYRSNKSYLFKFFQKKNIYNTHN